MPGEFEKPAEQIDIQKKPTPEEMAYTKAAKEGPILHAIETQIQSQRRFAREKQEKKSQKHRSSKKPEEQEELDL